MAELAISDGEHSSEEETSVLLSPEVKMEIHLPNFNKNSDD